MYDKQNANYGLYLAGMITEHQYYDLCEGKKAKKKVKAQDVNGDGKIDFIDVLASRMMASGMSKEEAIKKATAHAKKHKKKGMKDKPAHCCMENIGPTKLAGALGLDNAVVTSKMEPLLSALMHLHKNNIAKFNIVFNILKADGVKEGGDRLQRGRIISAIEDIESKIAKEAAKEQEKEQSM
jgi:hypothetical protein